MFGKLFKSAAASKASAKAVHVLGKTYSLQITHSQQLEMMNRIDQDCSDKLNEHEMAVQFLAEFSRTIRVDHPKAISEIEKYIRMSKGSYNRGLAHIKQPQQELFRVAQERFGIDPNNIDAV